jgi:C-type mannose receptor
MTTAPVLAPGEAVSPFDLLPVDIADENVGGTRTGAGAIDVVRDAGASDAGDGGDAGASARDAGGSPRDAGTPPSDLDASAAADAADGSTPPSVDASTPAPSDPCPGLVFEGSCYEFFGEPTSWSEAEARCAAWGGHLASVESSEEDAFIGAWPALTGVPLLDGSGLWLGGTDALRDGDFRWWDDRPLNFADWAPDQPNNGTGVDCIEKRNDSTQRWYDRRCTDGERYVCERPE